MAGRWYRARAVLDLEEGAVSLTVTSAEPAPSGNYELELGAELPAAELVHLQGSGAPHHLVLAAWEGPGSGPELSMARSKHRSSRPGPAGPGQAFVYAWRLGQGTRASELHDTSTARAPLRLVNAPTAGVTGHNWDGTVLDFTKAPEQYDALAFHDDDFEDAGWAPVAQVHLPVNLRSGVYALVVTNASGPRYVPFFVVPGPGRRRAKIAVLFSTFTYLAYANEHVREEVQEFAHVRTSPSPQDLEMAAHREFGLSLYDHHGDGTGVCYSSMRRPVVNFDPTYRFWLFDGPVHLGEDIYLLDWLERLGYDYDVLTDHQVHAEGAASPGRVPRRHHREPPGVCEQGHARRPRGPRPGGRPAHVPGRQRALLGHRGRPRAAAHDRDQTGQLGRAHVGKRPGRGLPVEHRRTGRPVAPPRPPAQPPARRRVQRPRRGRTSPGLPKGAQRGRRRPVGLCVRRGRRPRAIGEFGLLLGGAAGNEVDRADHTRGTPVGTVVLATSKGHSDEYQLAVEDILLGAPGQGGTEQPLVRADMVVVPYASGGTVFSVGAITWLGSLAYNNYDNDVAVVTGNVLRQLRSRSRRPAKRRRGAARWCRPGPGPSSARPARAGSRWP